ncbi:MAG: ECF-type sigma factor [Planctomycetaceae bacterium]
MVEQGSVSLWILEARDGMSNAQQLLWERYFQKLVRLARNRLRAMGKTPNDAEDIALNAFHSFYTAAEKGRFPNLADRDGLWRLLFQMTARKAVDHARHENRQKRGGGQIQGESVLNPSDIDNELQGMANVIGEEPTPEFSAMMAERCSELLAQLANHHETLPAIAEDKLAGFTNEEIAQRQNCSLRTVERQLKLIRDIWREQLDD